MNNQNPLSFSKMISIEEYKRLVKLISDIERQMVYITSGAVAISITILSFLLRHLFSDKNRLLLSAETAYITLILCFISILAFSLVVAHRNELMRAASYLIVFYEENLNRFGWDNRLKSFREQSPKQKEAHDPIPCIFWAITALAIILFWYILYKANTCWLHYLISIVPVLFIICLHRKYNSLLRNKYNDYIGTWRKLSNIETWRKLFEKKP